MKFITPTYFLTTTFVTTLLLDISNGAHLRRTTSISTSTADQLYCGQAPCVTLVELTKELRNRVPREDPNLKLYAAPNNTQINDWKSVVKSMLIADPRCESIPIPESLTEAKYTTARFTDEDDYDYCVLSSLPTQPYIENYDDEYSKYLWGTVIIRLRKNDIYFTKVSIDIPHPWSDKGTYAQGTSIFKNSNAKSLLLAGSERYTNGKNENSPKSDCDSRYNEADMAHGTNNMFHAAVEEIDNYFSGREGYTAIQFHGMGDTTCPGVDAFFSDGNDQEASSSGNKLRWNFETSSNFNEDTLKLVGEAECKMNGTRNIQGCFLNGVTTPELCRTESDEGGIFSTKPTRYDRKFLQIEQKENIRGEQYYKAWAEAVTNSFPSY